METLSYCLIILSPFAGIIAIMLMSWAMPSNKVKVAEGILKIVLSKVSISSIIEAFRGKNGKKN